MSHKKILVLTVSLALTAFAVAPLSAQPVVGRAVQVVGDATATLPTGVSSDLARSDELRLYTRIRTGKPGRVSMTFDPRGNNQLGDDTTVILSDSYLDDSGRRYTAFELLAGKIRLLLAPGSEAEVNAPAASIGVLGTDVRVAANERGTTLVAVYEGTVTVTDRTGAPPLTLEAGYMTVVEPGRRASQPTPIDPAGGWFPPFPDDADGPAVLDPGNLPIDRSPRP